MREKVEALHEAKEKKACLGSRRPESTEAFMTNFQLAQEARYRSKIAYARVVNPNSRFFINIF